MVEVVATQLYSLDAGSGLWVSRGRPPIDPSFVLGVTKPTAANTAVGLSTTSVVSTAQTYSTNGQTINDARFDNWVAVLNATGVTFNRCLFRGPPGGDTTLNKRIVEVHGSSVSGAVFNNCKFEPYDRTVQGWATGLGGHDYVANRCWFEGAIDQIDVYSFDGSIANVGVYGCYCVNLDCFYPSTEPGHSDGNHSDNLQITNGSHTEIIGNTMTGMLDPVYGNQGTGGGTPYYPQANSAIQTNQSSGSKTVADLLMQYNWFDGGSIAALNISDNGFGAIQNFRIKDNRFGRSGRSAPQTGAMTHAMQPWAVVTSSATLTRADPTWVVSGNVYEDDGTPVTIH